MKKLIIFFAALLAATAARAQEVTTAAPASVSVGQSFVVEYRSTLSGGRVREPVFENFEFQGSTMSMGSESENGRITSSFNVYSFALRATRAGVFTIPGLTIVSGGKTYTSRAVPIEVVEGTASSTQTPAQGHTSTPARAADGTEIFLRAVPDRTTVWRGEPVRVQFKLYSRNDQLALTKIDAPQMNGFWSEDVDVSSYRAQTENFNSSVYYTFVVGERLLFPLQAGRLVIDPMKMNLTVREVKSSRREQTLEEMMFGGGEPNFVDTPKSVQSTPLTITVKELPTGAPASFAGAVGSFTMTAEALQGDVMSNASSTYKLRIAGTGNFRQITAPPLTVPDSFETLNVKTIDETHVAARGMTGSKQFEYPLIARGEGSYRIDPVEFSYFDPASGRYETLTAPEVRLNVVPDSLGSAPTVVGSTAQKELQVLNKDIRFIKYDQPGLHRRGRLFVLSVWFFAIAALLVGAFVLLLRWLRKHLAQRRDARMMRVKRAGKVVHARLRVAEEHMQAGSERRFHDEMLKALWGYMGDKLNIPVANLTKENVREQLLRREVPAELAARYTDLISESETAQYSPAESAPMTEVFTQAAALITEIEKYFR